MALSTESQKLVESAIFGLFNGPRAMTDTQGKLVDRYNELLRTDDESIDQTEVAVVETLQAVLSSASERWRLNQGFAFARRQQTMLRVIHDSRGIDLARLAIGCGPADQLVLRALDDALEYGIVQEDSGKYTLTPAGEALYHNTRGM